MSSSAGGTGSQLVKGLEGVVAAQTRLCDLNGQEGKLAYQGYAIEDLAEHASFEEVVYLLWHGDLPTKAALDAFNRELVESRPLPPGLLASLRTFPRTAHPMAALQAAVAMLGMHDDEVDDSSQEVNLRKATRLVARIPTIIAAFHRLRQGLEPIMPDGSLNHAANFLAMLTGRPPDPESARAFDGSLVLYAEHELNASTFTGRVVVSTLSDMYAAVAAAIGALKGPLHGGANEAVMVMLKEIGSPDRVDGYIQEALTQKRRIMGFGHRVYRTGDPRARILKRMAEQACLRSGQGVWYQMSCRVDELVTGAKRIAPNVDFYSASLYYALGIPTDLFVPVIAVARIAGWSAHLLEQYDDNRLIRPRAEYVGPRGRAFVPLANR